MVEALRTVERQLSGAHWEIFLIVTGQGQTRPVFERQVAAAGFSARVVVATHYFQSFVSYAAMLSVCDVGLCVHRSSSGLDLPMKCVDMFGAGLPVLALDYPALDELVTSNTGWTFSDAESLAQHLSEMMNNAARAGMQTRRDAVIANRAKESWSNVWRDNALPVVRRRPRPGVRRSPTT